jgi:DNA-binding transcriptional ArsR family regulator
MSRVPTLPDAFFKQFAYEHFARMGKALSAPIRLVLLNVLNQGPHTVEALAEQAGTSVANASHHLKVLREAGLVEAERDGQFMRYEISCPEVRNFLRSLKKMAEQCSVELRQALADIEDSPTRVEAIGRAELVQRVADGVSIVVDVRPAEEFAAGHLPGAASMPLAELERRIDELPRDREIVAYCRGKYCLLADHAVARMRSAGLNARRTNVDVVDWTMADLPLESQSPHNPSGGLS